MKLIKFMRKIKTNNFIINEKYSNLNIELLKYLKEKNIDIYDFAYYFPEWFESELDNNIEDARKYLNWDEFEWDDLIGNPEYFYSFPDSVQDEFITYIREELIDHMMVNNPSEAPSWAHFMITDRKLLPRTTWLVHLSDYAYNIANQGFTIGVDRMDRLGLTRWASEFEKQHGGFNFAFPARSGDAVRATSSKKYGEHAVLFQNSGVKAYHYGDEETQIIFYGDNVDSRDIIYLERISGDWVVMPHPHKSHRGQDLKEGGVFIGSYESCARWVERNIDQYRKIITGR